MNDFVLPGVIQYTSIDFRGDMLIYRMSWLNTDMKPQGYLSANMSSLSLVCASSGASWGENKT